MKRSLSVFTGSRRGQSFVELALVVLILALLLAGVVEFGYMMNNYLHVFDAAREAARYASSADPFAAGYEEIFYYVTALKAAQTMMPVPLNPANDDDVIVSVFSVNKSGAVVGRFPSDTGWSLCANYADFKAYFVPNIMSEDGFPATVNGAGWYSCRPGTSQFSASDIASRLVSGAPCAGVLLVEIQYKYPQILKLPVLTSVIPDPVPLYVYSIMPNSAAEPPSDLCQ